MHRSPSNQLAEFIGLYPRLLVLTGAGCSIGSGIPAYRDQNGNWQRSVAIQHQEFVSQHSSRQKYWARSMTGWPRIAAARPNGAHDALADLERRGHITLLVTQNVDGLHQRAGQQDVIDLHGRLDRVKCLTCGAISARSQLQDRLQQLNPEQKTDGPSAPDGDAEVSFDPATFLVPACLVCEGTLMPDVVFYGGSVDRQLVDRIMESLAVCDGMLVIGSSLMVFSGYRFCRRAHQLGKPIACINPGTTRADEYYALKLKADCISTLAGLTGL